jgi:hypothetical protein
MLTLPCFRAGPVHRSLLPYGIVAGLPTLLLLVTAAGCTRSRAPVDGDAAPAESRGDGFELYGYVLSGKDSSRVAGATIYTEPQSAVARSDSNGYWKITRGLVPGSIEVIAELDGESGKAKLSLSSAKSEEEVYILLGQEETAWPPGSVIREKVKVLPGPPRQGGRGEQLGVDER